MSDEAMAFIYALSLAFLALSIGVTVFLGWVWINSLVREVDEGRDKFFGGV